MAVAKPTIVSVLPNNGNGTTYSDLLTLSGTDTPGSTVSVLDGTTVLGTATVDTSGNWAFTTNALANGAQSFTAVDAGVASAPFQMTVSPDITSFSGLDNARIVVGGLNYVVQDASQAWSLTNPDTHTLRFEMRGGDLWPEGGSARSEIASYPQMFPNAETVNVSYQLKVEPGTAVPVTNQFVILGQLHGNDNAWQPSPAWPNVSIQLTGPTGISGGEHLAIQADYAVQGVDTRPHPLGTNGYLYIDPNNIVRGEYYNIQLEMNVSNTSAGFLEAWINGVQVVDYHGPLGYGGGTYWKEGIYRDPSDTYTMAADFQNTIVTTGTTPPPPPPPNFVSFSPDVNGIDNTNTINLAGTAEANSTVTIFDGSTNLGTTAVNSTGNWVFGENNAANGTHTFTATDTDANGTSVASAAFPVTVNAPPPPANLVTDGGFENGFTGWREKGQNGDFSLTTDVHSGVQAASLHDIRGGPDTLSQTLNTVVGQTYTLDFWLANTAAGQNSFAAKIGGHALFTETNAPQEGYTEHTVQFTATNTVTTIGFQFHNPAAWHLDDVAVH